MEHDEAARTVLMRRGADVVAVNLGSGPAELDVAGVEGGGAGDDLRVVLAWRPDETTLEGGRLLLPPESAAIVAPQVD